MCGSLSLTPSEVLRTEKAIRKILGEGAGDWIFGGFLRLEGLELEESADGDQFTWGTEKWRGAIHALFSLPIEGFWEKSRESGRNLFFETQAKLEEPSPEDPSKKILRLVAGSAIVAAYDHWKHPGKTCFGLVTAKDPRVGALCRHDRGPIVLPRKGNPVAAFRALFTQDLAAIAA